MDAVEALNRLKRQEAELEGLRDQDAPAETRSRLRALWIGLVAIFACTLLIVVAQQSKLNRLERELDRRHNELADIINQHADIINAAADNDFDQAVADAIMRRPELAVRRLVVRSASGKDAIILKTGIQGDHTSVWIRGWRADDSGHQVILSANPDQADVSVQPMAYTNSVQNGSASIRTDKAGVLELRDARGDTRILTKATTP
jgi:hypothetical protein